MSTEIQATVEDLYHVPETGKAEIVQGKLVLMAPTGGVPSRASGEIYVRPALPGWSMSVDELFT